MSAEVQESGGKRGKSKQKKITVRVDFTPMVDMNMLLITFFMLCTTLSKPQTMEISMPSNDKDITENQKSMVKASQAITLLLGPDNKLYYYEGEPNYKDYTSLKETSYGVDFFSCDIIEYSQAVSGITETVGILTFGVFVDFGISFTVFPDIGKSVYFCRIRPPIGR